MATDPEAIPEVTPEATQVGLGNDLIKAVRLDNIAEIRKLLDLGADIDARDEEYGQIAVSLAAENGYLEVVKTLCDCGVNLEIADYRGNPPVDWAVGCGHWDVIRVFREHVRSFSASNAWRNILFTLADFGQAQDLERYINEFNPDLDSRNDNRLTPLILAATNGQNENVKVLLKAGAPAPMPRTRIASLPSTTLLKVAKWKVSAPWSMQKLIHTSCAPHQPTRLKP